MKKLKLFQDNTCVYSGWSRARLLATCTLLTTTLLLPCGAIAAKANDTHYNKAGFFDVHVCNWPGRPLFFMPLFSTTKFEDVREVEVLYPDNSRLTRLDLSRYNSIKKKGKPDKRVFIKQLDIPEGAQDGWYTANITLANGEILQARDYIIIKKLAIAKGQYPGNEQELSAPPKKLTWESVPGAAFYKVFIRDIWNNNNLIYTSPLLAGPELTLPENLIERGGEYSWVIHARDTNEDLKLGDFNHGSLSKPATFSVEQ